MPTTPPDESEFPGSKVLSWGLCIWNSYFAVAVLPDGKGNGGGAEERYK